MGFAAGAMLALVAIELGPNAWKRLGPKLSIGSYVAGAGVMLGLTLAITTIG